MRLIPPTISESTRSDGERVVFDALAAVSAPGSTVLHSFDNADHRRRLAGEIDFLCVVPGQGVLVLSPYGNERCAAVRLTEQPWCDRPAPLVTELGDDGDEDEEVGDWLAACIPSDLDAVDLRSSKIKYSSIYRFKGLEAPAVVITDVHALDTPGQRSLLSVGCTRALHRLVILADGKVREQLTT